MLLRNPDIVLHAGDPAHPIADNFSDLLMGHPPPHAAIRASVGAGQKRRVALDKVEKSCVETPSQSCNACYAPYQGRNRGSIHRLNALRLLRHQESLRCRQTQVSLAFAHGGTDHVLC